MRFELVLDKGATFTIAALPPKKVAQRAVFSLLFSVIIAIRKKVSFGPLINDNCWGGQGGPPMQNDNGGQRGPTP